MRAKFGSFLDASLTDENCELRRRTSKLRIRDRVTESCPERKPSRRLAPAVLADSPLPPRRCSRLGRVEAMSGTDQVRMLADQLQAGAMLRYNKRMVG